MIPPAPFFQPERAPPGFFADVCVYSRKKLKSFGPCFISQQGSSEYFPSLLEFMRRRTGHRRSDPKESRGSEAGPHNLELPKRDLGLAEDSSVTSMEPSEVQKDRTDTQVQVGQLGPRVEVLQGVLPGVNLAETGEPVLGRPGLPVSDVGAQESVAPVSVSRPDSSGNPDVARWVSEVSPFSENGGDGLGVAAKPAVFEGAGFLAQMGPFGQNFNVTS